jgi:uncharacterized protein YcaQ
VPAVLEVSLPEARRLAIVRQRLAGSRPSPTAEGILELVRELGCLQLDPTNTVARTHLLVLWSRLGRYSPALVDRLAYRERRLFEYWAHQYSLVPADDYPIHELLMRSRGESEGSYSRRMREWLSHNAEMRAYVLEELERRGPLRSRELEDRSVKPWLSTGWTNQRNVSRLLDVMNVDGEVLVSRREGGQRLWDLAERCLPSDHEPGGLAEREVVRRSVQRALGALGVARPPHIRAHFTRDRYPDMPGVRAELVAEGSVVEASVGDLPGPWYLRAEDVALLEQLRSGGAWRARTTLLSPFDNLICDRARTQMLWGFDFRLEIYTPVEKRRYGFFVMPVLSGDRFIARVDPAMDRRRGVLVINAVHPEARGASAAAARAGAGAIRRLATWLGASDVEVREAPAAWRRALAA